MIKKHYISAKSAVFAIRTKSGRRNAKLGAENTTVVIWKLQLTQSNIKR